MSFTASHGRRCEMLSVTPTLVILKLKSRTGNGHSGYAFGMMGRAFHPNSCQRAVPVTTGCPECVNAPSRSVANSISGAELEPVRRLISASLARLHIVRLRAALFSVCSGRKQDEL